VLLPNFLLNLVNFFDVHNKHLQFANCVWFLCIKLFGVKILSVWFLNITKKLIQPSNKSCLTMFTVRNVGTYSGYVNNLLICISSIFQKVYYQNSINPYYIHRYFSNTNIIICILTVSFIQIL